MFPKFSFVKAQERDFIALYLHSGTSIGFEVPQMKF